MRKCARQETVFALALALNFFAHLIRSGLVHVTSGAARALQIPRRPLWDADTSPETLHRAEKDAFLAWRRMIAQIEAENGGGAARGGAPLAVTPFEKNVEVWRQLWRVVERSDVLVQIVDARNPLLFHSADLDAYVGEVSEHKRCVLLINKADFLTVEQRLAWAHHLSRRGMQFAFFSAKLELDRLEELDRAQAAFATVAKHGDFDFAPTGLASESERFSSNHAASSIDAASFVGHSETSFASMRRTMLDLPSDDDTGAAHLSDVTDAPLVADAADVSPGGGLDRAVAGSDERVGASSCPGAGHAQDVSTTVEACDAAKHGAGDAADPAEPMAPLVHILTREELLEFLQKVGSSVPRGVFGSGSELAKRKALELRARLRAEAAAARKDELRRRRDVAARLVSVGLGSQLRFAGAVDALGLEGDEEGDDDSVADLGLDDAAAETPPLTVG
jgi:hypothetical protein